jgi:Txe/YoeB family toxin of Txe-Axe toxin-antitoxin module
MTLAELQEQATADPYNTVEAFMLPSGELAVVLSHRITEDECVVVRVREDVDVISLYGDPERFSTINTGGDWPEEK